MKMLSAYYLRRLHRLLHSQHGSALPIVALGMFALMGATGVAIDMSRVQIVQSRMQNALDAAGLAAGATISTVNVDTVTNQYFYANFPANYLGTTISSLTAVPNNDNSIITLSVAGTVHTTFMKIFGVNTVNVSATSQVTRAAKGMELVLVMDNTGSMTQTAGGGVTKLDAAKSAGATLLNILYGSTHNTVENLWVGVVPFSQAVNIGTGNDDWTVNTTFDWGPSPSGWMGCVDAREANGRDVTDDPPSVELFPKYYWPDDGNNNWKSAGTISTTTNLCFHQSSCTCANYGPCTSSTDANGVQTTVSCSGSGGNRQCNRVVVTPVTNYITPLNTSRGPNKSCSQAVLPMVAEKNTVISSLNSMAAVGNTHIDLGMGWAWRMLSPSWRGLWGGQMDTNNLPLDYNTPLMNKVVVLMTDGDNTIDSSNHGAYWYLSDNHLGTTNSSAAVTQLNTRTTTICNSMKAKGILIYTVALGTSFNTASLNMLQACASKPEYAFVSPTTADLETDFRMIGDSLANLRISQ
jgi:Flp pilus assembly protein TadG